MRIDEKETGLCKYCCYCNWSIGETTICKNTLDRKLRGIMKEKLKKRLRYRKLFICDECTVDSLMNIEKDYVQCKGCSFVWFAEKDGSCNICSYSLNIDLDEVI